MKPLVKWVGGKRWLSWRLRQLYEPHQHRVYCEPFAGGAAGALALEPPSVYLSDINGALINCYNQVKQGLTLSADLVNDRATFLHHRSEYNLMENHDTARAAVLLLYLVKTGFNGLYRVNKSGAFNVPMGRNKSVNYKLDFAPYQELFQGWTFGCHSFDAVSYPPDWFIFADPPYWGTFNGYASTPFQWADQVRLADVLAAHPGPVVATNSSVPEILELYRSRGFEIELLPAPRRISCKGSARANVEEMVATRNV